MSLSRRRMLSVTAAGLGALAGGVSSVGAADAASTPTSPSGTTTAKRWKFSLNTSTIRGQKLPLDAQFDVAAAAGYDGVEPWIGDIEAFVKNGGSPEDLAKKAADRNLKVVSAIGFAQWIVDDDAKRKAGLEQAKRDMELVRRLGGTRIAAPPAGETNNPKLDLFAAAERYRAPCDVGRQVGVTPMVEVWGFSKCLSAPR
ncbi:MAG: TIM barrel protein [Pirellulales bacterium]